MLHVKGATPALCIIILYPGAILFYFVGRCTDPILKHFYTSCLAQASIRDIVASVGFLARLSTHYKVLTIPRSASNRETAALFYTQGDLNAVVWRVEGNLQAVFFRPDMEEVLGYGAQEGVS